MVIHLRSLTLMQANKYYNEKRFAMAIDAYSTALDLAPQCNLATSPRDLATLHYNRARARYRLGQHCAAIEDCSTALRHDGTYRNALAQRAECYMSLFDFERAARDFTGLLESDSSDRQWARRLLDARQMRDMSHYGILGVSKDADANVLKRAYRSLCLRWHPDKHDNGPEDATRANTAFRRITTAYETLNDNYKRMLYDMDPASNAGTPIDNGGVNAGGSSLYGRDVNSRAAGSRGDDSKAGATEGFDRWYARERERESEREAERNAITSREAADEAAEEEVRAAARARRQTAIKLLQQQKLQQQATADTAATRKQKAVAARPPLQRAASDPARITIAASPTAAVADASIDSANRPKVASTTAAAMPPATAPNGTAAGPGLLRRAASDGGAGSGSVSPFASISGVDGHVHQQTGAAALPAASTSAPTAAAKPVPNVAIPYVQATHSSTSGATAAPASAAPAAATAPSAPRRPVPAVPSFSATPASVHAANDAPAASASHATTPAADSLNTTASSIPAAAAAGNGHSVDNSTIGSDNDRDQLSSAAAATTARARAAVAQAEAFVRLVQAHASIERSQSTSSGSSSVNTSSVGADGNTTSVSAVHGQSADTGAPSRQPSTSQLHSRPTSGAGAVPAKPAGAPEPPAASGRRSSDNLPLPDGVRRDSTEGDIGADDDEKAAIRARIHARARAEAQARLKAEIAGLKRDLDIGDTPTPRSDSNGAAAVADGFSVVDDAGEVAIDGDGHNAAAAFGASQHDKELLRSYGIDVDGVDVNDAEAYAGQQHEHHDAAFDAAGFDEHDLDADVEHFVAAASGSSVPTAPSAAPAARSGSSYDPRRYGIHGDGNAVHAQDKHRVRGGSADDNDDNLTEGPLDDDDDAAGDDHRYREQIHQYTDEADDDDASTSDDDAEDEDATDALPGYVHREQGHGGGHGIHRTQHHHHQQLYAGQQHAPPPSSSSRAQNTRVGSAAAVHDDDIEHLDDDALLRKLHAAGVGSASSANAAFAAEAASGPTFRKLFSDAINSRVSAASAPGSSSSSRTAEAAAAAGAAAGVDVGARSPSVAAYMSRQGSFTAGGGSYYAASVPAATSARAQDREKTSSPVRQAQSLAELEAELAGLTADALSAAAAARSRTTAGGSKGGSKAGADLERHMA